VKRAFDVVVSAVGLALGSPVLVAVAVAVRLRLGKPVLFRQRRAGRHDEAFEVVKFRTMRDAVDHRGVPLPDEERLTPLGRWLRSSSLDELPELWNVLRGEMSLVGPRPLPVAYLPRYTPRERRRHEVRPGITGWAQINGRNLVDWDERLEMDVWYVEHRSMALDLRILWRTARAVLVREGISAEGHATMQVLRPHLHEPEGES
jgi:lipopolysaccharide/colanic/teichoic acid biosynthesis glycosyltransferase